MSYKDFNEIQILQSDLIVSGNVIGGTEPTEANHLATKNFVDNIETTLSNDIASNSANFSNFIPLSGSDQITGDLIPSSSGTVDLGSATKAYQNIYTNNINIENEVTISSLTGDNTIVISNTSGVLQDTTMSITEGLSGGSIINVIEFGTDPLSAELVQGDLWVVDSPSTSGKLLKYWDGINKYSVEMSKE